jgi:hypothetical protein
LIHNIFRDICGVNRSAHGPNGGHRIVRLNDKRAARGHNTGFLSDDAYRSEWWWISGAGRILSQTSADASHCHKRETNSRNRHDIVLVLSGAIWRPALNASIAMISRYRLTAF